MLHATNWISGYTLESVELHKVAVDKLCDAVEENIVHTSEFVQVVDDISQDMLTVQRLSQQIADIRGSLDWLEETALSISGTTHSSSGGNMFTDAFAAASKNTIRIRTSRFSK
ncbi:hypothetical protein BATDEDRAFT_86452 [Batrachochytrium dendrobatidis JAM81]|uniref:BLOC-1-related complex subunit 6 C-terminal helix domain-containing protein n=1 Tax=Batrachochytrium dendrobatidis (strain JAM81 / FGSC 10211) TaxID=684364 RepID=F4NW44_BATDJ|nr:uncharacterized protein BATDEDRAFT_86452 [Batrachochytrium dendrobatidis JAM81]EGF82767.1 hypothetical protein BATDEDRAFT_86452 [Batrachochytrium dendrobatidis JAM81]|eukprot:XP_006677049.1 hypothetical protein BATDEDRAFT_86452 [Batrachochytrium dendrobatidis JAM81]